MNSPLVMTLSRHSMSPAMMETGKMMKSLSDGLFQGETSLKKKTTSRKRAMSFRILCAQDLTSLQAL